MAEIQGVTHFLTRAKPSNPILRMMANPDWNNPPASAYKPHGLRGEVSRKDGTGGYRNECSGEINA